MSMRFFYGLGLTHFIGIRIFCLYCNRQKKLKREQITGLTHFTEIGAFCELKIVGNDSLVSK